MAKLGPLKCFPREQKRDARGWLLKAYDGRELPDGHRPGEIYVVCSHPGEARGHHYHPRATEFFTVIQGAAALVLESPDDGEQQVILLEATRPQTVEVPPGVAHVVIARGKEPLIMVAVASEPHDPRDVVSYVVHLRDDRSD